MEKASIYMRLEQGSNSGGRFEAQAQEFCKGRGYEVLGVHVEYYDRPVTSTNIEILQECIQEVFSNDKSVLVTPTMRDIESNLACVAYIIKTGVPLLASDEPNLDTTSMKGFIELARKSIEHRIAVKSRNVKKGIEKARGRGKKLGSPNVLKAVEKASKLRMEGAAEFRLKIIPILREIRSEEDFPVTLRDYKRGLEKRNILTRTGNKTWQESTIRNILKKERGDE